VHLPSWKQVGGCGISGACFALVATSCSAEVIATGPAGAAACVGTLGGAAAFGCKDALDSCAGKLRRLEVKKPVSKRRDLALPSWVHLPSWKQVGGCGISGACFALVATSCSAEVIATGPAGAAACVGTIGGAAAFGCKDALNSCAGKRRLF